MTPTIHLYNGREMTQIPQNHELAIKWLICIFVIFTLFPQEDSLGLFSVIRDITRNQYMLSLLLLQLVLG